MFENQDDKNLRALVRMMTHRLGRVPTEEEVKTYIFGTDEERLAMIPNQLVQER